MDIRGSICSWKFIIPQGIRRSRNHLVKGIDLGGGAEAFRRQRWISAGHCGKAQARERPGPKLSISIFRGEVGGVGGNGKKIAIFFRESQEKKGRSRCRE